MKISPELQKAVAEYQKGSVEAFNTIYEQSYKYLHTCVIHVVKNEDMAMDMLQETYLEISKSISQLKSTEDFLSWAAMIANRKCFAHLKKQKDILLDGSGLGEGDSDSADSVTDYFENIADNEEFIPETVLQDREKQRLIKEIIDGLNDMQRLCVIGFYYNEQKQEEIAEELGIPVNTVKSHLNRAKAKIKEAVVELDVKKGTRLYSFAPFMALLFREEVQACVLRPMSKGLASAVGISAGVGSGALPGGLEAVKEFITENFGETLGEIFADTIGKAAIKVKALWAKFTAASIQTKAVVATTACAVTIGGAAVVMSPEEEVVDVLSADLDIVVTEEKIISELYDIDYTYSEEEQRYECVFHLWSDEEHKYVSFDAYNNIYSEIEEDCVDGFKLGDLEFKEYIWDGKSESDSTCYVLPIENDTYINMTCDNFSEGDLKAFINCMYELKSSDNSEEYFNIKKDRMDSYLWGFGIDLEKLKDKTKQKIYYSYRFRDMCYERHLTHEISNDVHQGYTNMEEFWEWYKGAEKSLVLALKEDYVQFNDLDWVCYTHEYNPGYFYLYQKTVMNGTAWSLDISQFGKNESIHDVYNHFMKNFNLEGNKSTISKYQSLIDEKDEENSSESERENISEQVQSKEEIESDSLNLVSEQEPTISVSPITDATLVYSYETWGAAAKTYRVEEYSNGIWVSRAIEGWEGCEPEYWILRTDFSDCLLDEDGNGIDDRDPYNDCGYTDLNHNCMADGAPQLEMYCPEEEHTPFWTCEHGIINGAYICQRTECQEFREMMRNTKVYVNSASD